MAVLVEEFHKKASGDDCWDEEEHGDEYEPPVDVITQDEIEDLDESGEDKEKGKNSGSNDSTLDWEASKARETSGFRSGAIADAAAANFGVLNSSMSWVNFFFLWVKRSVLISSVFVISSSFVGFVFRHIFLFNNYYY